MHKESVIVFANFKIDNKERYQRMQDSFLSFKNLSAKKWVINIRGAYRDEAFIFLENHLGKKLNSYRLNSKKGWFHDTRLMLNDIDTDFVFFWIEDHINMVDSSIYDEILTEMKGNNCDYLGYSFHHKKYLKKFELLPSKKCRHLNLYYMDKKNIKIIENKIGNYFYIISACCFMSLKLFRKIILSSHPFLKRWPKETPFDFEKRSTDFEFIPFNLGVSKFELFACIDDDHTVKGYSLISRKLYANRISRKEMLNLELNVNKYKKVKKFIPKTFRKFFSYVQVFLVRIKYTIM